MSFEELKLQKLLLDNVRRAEYSEPTPIQQQTIPLVLQKKDVLGCAQTGTGKTAAFALPILHNLLPVQQKKKDRAIRALVLTPTRELAQQIYETFELFGARTGLDYAVIYGGVRQEPQVAKLNSGVDVLIATPGRLNDLKQQGYIHLDKLEVFVLDEADRMLDMGFIHDVKRVISYLPARRQTLFFSATMPADVEALAMSILSQPEMVKVDPPSSTVDSIRQTLYMVDKPNKKQLLTDIISRPEVENALVFVRTKHGCDNVVRALVKKGISAAGIHGDKSQNSRQNALNSFKSGEIKILVATDIAARGIDIQGLSHVINYDLPNEPDAYVHRIGRTGRAGLDGDAISFCCIDEMDQLTAIEKMLQRRIPRSDCPYPMEIFEPTVKEPRPPRTETKGEIPKKLTMSGEAYTKKNNRFPGKKR